MLAGQLSGRGTVRPGRCVYAGPGAESLPNVIINRDWTVHVQRSAAAGLLVHAGMEFLSENGNRPVSKRPPGGQVQFAIDLR